MAIKIFNRFTNVADLEEEVNKFLLILNERRVSDIKVQMTTVVDRADYIRYNILVSWNE